MDILGPGPLTHVVVCKITGMATNSIFSLHFDGHPAISAMAEPKARAFTAARIYVPMTQGIWSHLGLVLDRWHIVCRTGDLPTLQAVIREFNMKGKKRPKVVPVSPAELEFLRARPGPESPDSVAQHRATGRPPPGLSLMR